MIVEYLRYTIPSAQQDAFIRDYAAAKEPLLRSPYALAFDMSRCAEDPFEIHSAYRVVIRGRPYEAFQGKR
jgi:hypothetical protein